VNLTAWKELRDVEPYVYMGRIPCKGTFYCRAIRLSSSSATHAMMGNSQLIGLLRIDTTSNHLSALVLNKTGLDQLMDDVPSYRIAPDRLFKEFHDSPLFHEGFKNERAAADWTKKVSMEKGILFDLKLKYLGALGILADIGGPPDFIEVANTE